MHPNSRFPLPLVALSLLGIALVLYQTRFGPGASGDSTSYLMGAENIRLGNGYARYSGGYEIKPITGFPPLFSAVLAMVGLLGVEGSTAARMVNAALFGANILMVGGLIWAYTDSGVAALLGSLTYLSADTQFELHSWVMSEPLYVLLALAAIWALARHLSSPRPRWFWLLAAAALSALASLTRLVGPAIVAAGIIVILVMGAAGWRRRFGAAIAYGALSLIPLVVWLQRNRLVAGTAVNREIGFHPMDPQLVRHFLAEISSWFVPHEVPLPTGARAGLAILIAAGLLGAFAFLAARSWFKPGHGRLQLTGPSDARLPALPWILAAYIGCNLAIVYLNSTFFDAGTTLAAPERYLAPVYAALVPLGVMAGVAVWRAVGRRPLLLTAAIGYLLALGAFQAATVAETIRDPLPYLGYTGRRITWSEVVERLEQLPREVPIVSNNPEMIYILIGRPAYVRPISYDQYQNAVRQDYEQQFAFITGQMERGAAFVVFDQLEPDDIALIDGLSLRQVAEYPQASIYQAPGAESDRGEGMCLAASAYG